MEQKKDTTKEIPTTAAQDGVEPTAAADISASTPANTNEPPDAPPPQEEEQPPPPGIDEEALTAAQDSINGKVGLKNVKKIIRQKIANTRLNALKKEIGIIQKNKFSHNLAFFGPKGTGKATITKEMAKIYHALGIVKKSEIQTVQYDDLIAGIMGQGSEKTANAVNSAGDGILLIKDFYTFLPTMGPQAAEIDQKKQLALSNFIESRQHDVIFVITGQNQETEQALHQHKKLSTFFETSVDFEPYTQQELADVMDHMLEHDYHVQMTQEARQKALEILDTERQQSGDSFDNGHALKKLLEKATQHKALRLDAEGVLQDDHGLTDDQRKEKIMTITLNDVKNITLKVEAKKKPQQKRKIGFQ